MTKRFEIYKCQDCGNMVEVIHENAGTLSCCGQNMALITENTVDAAKEKHVPAVSKSGDGILAKIGSVAHPMEEKHYIEWIQVITPDGKSDRKFLKPGMAPEAIFCSVEENAAVREYCNIHGLWKR